AVLAATGAWFALLHGLPVAGLIDSGFCAWATEVIDVMEIRDINAAMESVAMLRAREEWVCLNIGLVLVITYDGSQQMCNAGNQHRYQEEHQCVIESARFQWVFGKGRSLQHRQFLDGAGGFDTPLFQCDQGGVVDVL